MLRDPPAVGCYLRVVLVGTAVPNMLSYGLHFSTFTDHEVIVTLLIPNEKRRECQERIVDFLKTTKGMNMRILPIFLNSPNYRLRNLLNFSIVLKDFSSIFKTLKHLAPDVVICYYLLDAYPFILLKGILKYSLYVVAMGSDVNLHTGLFYRSLRKLIYRGSDLIFAVSYALRDKIENESGRQTIVARTGVDANFFRPLNSKLALREKWRFRPEDKVLLMVCNLVKHKGVDVAIEALDMLSKERSSMKLVIVGSGPEERKLKEFVSKLQLERKVVFLGIKNRQELVELYNAADVFVLASSSEGLPFVLLEAMACGLVCVVTEVGDIGTVVTPGKNGFLVPKRNSATLAKTINGVFSLSEGDIRLIGNRARKTIEMGFCARFSVKTIVKAIEQTRACDARFQLPT
ncbi:MAG: glycosyltransferase family 4 protein [Candidatus Hodarchaeota archaeon]